MRFVKRLFFVLLAAYCVLLLAFWLFQSRLFYYPPNRPLETCNLPKGVELFDQDGLRGLFTEGGDKLLVFFHGNGESACSWRYLGRNHAGAHGYDVLVVEYPGYEDASLPSKVRIDEMRMRLGEWWDKQDYDKTVLMGFSLGTGVAAEALGMIPADAVLLFAPYDRMLNVARDQAGFIPLPGFVLSENYDALSAFQGYHNPLVLVHGAEDRVILPQRSAALAAVVPQSVRIVRAGLGHNGLFDTAFLDHLLQQYLP